MLKSLNTALRLLVVGLLIYPLPLAMADHVPTQPPYGTNASDDANAGTFTIGILGSDGFEDSPPESYTIFFSQSSGVTETNSFCVTTSFGHSTNTWQYHTFSLDNLKYYFNDPAGTNIYYRVRSNNITDYSFSTLTNQNTWNLYAGAPFDYNQTNWSAPTGDNACDDPKILDGIGDPSNLTISANLHDGSITIDWDAALDRYEYSAERYAIGFDKADPPMYGIATGNVGDSNALNTEYTFTKSYLQSALDAQAGDTIYFKIRADNDTSSKYSNWTSIASYTIQDVAAGVTNLTIENTEYQGLKFTWTNPGTGWSSPTSYKIEYSDGDNTWNYDDDDVYSQNISDASLTTYNLESIAAGTYWFSFYACTQNGSWCHGNQGTSPVQITVNATTPTTTTTIPPFVGPPMNPVITQEYNVGVKVDWDVANTGTLTAETYDLYFRTDATNETIVYNLTETEYTIPYASIPNGDWTFSIRGYSSDDDVYSGFSTEPTVTIFNQKAQDDADAAAEAARKAEEARIAAEKAEQERLDELQRQRDKNLADTGYSETDSERSAREQREYEEEQARLKALEEERIRNADETGYLETNSERADREQKEYEEEQARLAELERQRVSNEADTGIYETDAERSERERLEIEEAARKATIAATKATTDSEGDGEPLTKDEQDKLDLLVNTIIDLKKTLDPEQYAVEEEVFEIKEIVVVTTTTTTTTTTIPIIEDFADEEDEEILEVEPLPSDEGDEAIQLTEEEVEILVEETEEAIAEVITIDIVEEEPIDTENLTEEEVVEAEEKADQELTEKVEAAVAELPTEEKVKVVQAVAETKIQNLGSADKTTQKVVQAVVKEVTKVETVATLSEEQKTEVGQVLGFTEEEASEDLTIIAEQAATDENTAQALDEFVERSIASSDVEDFTLADVVTEVQIEAFISDPIGAIIDVNLESIDFATIGQDMTSDQRQKSKEVVVPVIIASQIIAQAGALITRRPF